MTPSENQIVVYQPNETVRFSFAARMLAHPSGSAFAESTLRNALHFCGAFPRWARKSSPDFSTQSARRHRDVVPPPCP